MGENNPLRDNSISRDILALTWPKQTQSLRQKSWVSSHIHWEINTTYFPQLGDEKQQQKCQGRIPATDPFSIELQDLGKL